MKTFISRSNDVAECVAGLKGRAAVDPAVVLFFASSRLDNAKVARSFQDGFPNAKTIGCSTAGEIVSGSMSDGSVTAMAISRDSVDDAAVAYIANPGDPAEVTAALGLIETTIGSKLQDLDSAKYVGLVVVDGLSGAEEKLIEKLGDLTDIPFVGGSAGDDLAFAKTWVSLNGTASDHGAVIAVLHAPTGYQIVKTQSFSSTGKQLRATLVNEATRTVLEFDGQPAAAAYAKALGVAESELDGEFMSHPLGLMVAGVPFVRSPQRVNGTGVVFYCNVLEGMELEILQATDIVAGTKECLESKGVDGASTSALINFNCILRTLELKAKSQCDDYGQLFTDIPTIGFSTYGEAYLGHINQTATMLAFPA